MDHFKGGGIPLVLKGGGMKSISTEGGVGDGLLLCREGWEVVVIVNTTGLIGLSTEFLCV